MIQLVHSYSQGRPMKTPGINNPHENITTILSNISISKFIFIMIIMICVIVIIALILSIFWKNTIVFILFFITRYPDYFGNVDSKALAPDDSPGTYPNFFGERVDSPIIGPKTS